VYKVPLKTVYMGKKIISLPACESTNTVLAALAETDRLEEGSVVITENQTHGRGQAGNRWLAEPGTNLTFSVLLKPEFLEPSHQFYLNMAVGLAVTDAIQAVSGLIAMVKWPNDVLIEDKKVCGILIENQIHGQKLSQTIVGIGLNVNQKNFEWPQASSLSLSVGRYFNRAEVLEKLLEKLDSRYLALKAGDWPSLSRNYHERLYRRRAEHEFESGGEIFSGSIEGVDEVGRLRIKTNRGWRVFNFKEVTFIM
jgi:BirA family transcriptional regulator, biotin operon repressor / biotin---[acetyl-CoA-carboxylase] ligase